MPFPEKSHFTETDYYNLPDDKRAELIEGQLYDQAVPRRIHQEVLNAINTKIFNYIASGNGPCKVYPAPFAVKLFDDNETIVEPDISVICDKNKLTEKGCSGAPDWIIEIVSPGNPSNDYIRKLNLYANAGVREYWIVNPVKKNIFVYHLEATKFEVNIYSFQDKIKVNIYDDLCIDFRDIDI